MRSPNQMADAEKAPKTGGLSHRARAAGQRLGAQRAIQKIECDRCDQLDLPSSHASVYFPQSALVRCRLGISQEGFKVGDRFFQAILQIHLGLPAKLGFG